MTQLDLLALAPLLADPEIDGMLRRAGLPFETRHADGTRRCRHHPESAIPSRAHPCPACIAAGCSTAAPDVTPMGGEMARLSIWNLVAMREQVVAPLGVPADDTRIELDGLVKVQIHRRLQAGELETIAAKLAAGAPEIRVEVVVEGVPAITPKPLPGSPRPLPEAP